MAKEPFWDFGIDDPVMDEGISEEERIRRRRARLTAIGNGEPMPVFEPARKPEEPKKDDVTMADVLAYLKERDEREQKRRAAIAEIERDKALEKKRIAEDYAYDMSRPIDPVTGRRMGPTAAQKRELYEAYAEVERQRKEREAAERRESPDV